MLATPFKAMRLGAETINKNPVKYNKSRLSGSKLTTYNLHIRGAFMPGKKDKFTATSKSKPQLNTNLLINTIMSNYKLDKIDTYNYKIVNENHNKRNLLKIKEFVPNDDDVLLIVINTLYKNIFGNFYLMESERPVEIERKLRNGDITIKEFIRKLCKSSIYRNIYFDNISQYKSIKLRYKHILGRPIKSQREVIESSRILDELGYESHIDWLIDSIEYNNFFGEDTVPYIRSWNSPTDLKTKSFLETSFMTKAFATSDICSNH
tara:strand:- start:1829 stop:2620 length:792 start_codon:yes stop_codon:yes gene_type:complete